MKAYYSHRVVDLDEPLLTLKNRAFLYGDGLFETLIFEKDKIKYVDSHLHRLRSGMEALGMIPTNDLNLLNIENRVKELISLNNLTGTIRIKLQVWRKPGGLYTPENNEIESLINVQEQHYGHKEKVADISKDIKIHYSHFSRFKTCNMLPYVLAGLEKRKRNLNELVLLNGQGFIAECSAANIFWVKDGIYYTPALESGCIEGIKRGVILNELKKRSIPFKEVLEGPDHLYNADFVFACNVAGIYPLVKIGINKYTYKVESFLFDL